MVRRPGTIGVRVAWEEVSAALEVLVFEVITTTGGQLGQSLVTVRTRSVPVDVPGATG